MKTKDDIEKRIKELKIVEQTLIKGNASHIIIERYQIMIEELEWILT